MVYALELSAALTEQQWQEICERVLGKGASR